MMRIFRIRWPGITETHESSNIDWEKHKILQLILLFVSLSFILSSPTLHTTTNIYHCSSWCNRNLNVCWCAHLTIYQWWARTSSSLSPHPGSSTLYSIQLPVCIWSPINLGPRNSIYLGVKYTLLNINNSNRGLNETFGTLDSVVWCDVVDTHIGGSGVHSSPADISDWLRKCEFFPTRLCRYL